MLHAFMETLYRDGQLLHEQTGWGELDSSDQEALLDAESMTEEYLDSIDAHSLMPEVFVQLQPDVGGSADLIATGDDVVAIIDAKFGFKPVTDRAQFLHYALCALETPGVRDLFFRDDGTAKTIHSVIIQPACQTKGQVYEHTLGELEEYRAALLQAIDARDTAQPTAGEHCGYCPAAPYCTARREQAARFLDLDVKSIPELAEAMTLVDQMKEQIRDVEAEVFAQLENGAKVPGWKLVMKQARRYWVDAEAALKALKASRKVKHDMYIDEKLKSPAQVEKSVGKLFDIKPFVDNKSSGTTLAPESDKRPAVIVALPCATADLFAYLGK